VTAQERRLATRLAVPARVRRVLFHPLTILVLLLCVFFYKEIVFGRVFSPADQLYDYQPWASVRPPSYHGASNPLRSDDTFIFYPHRIEIVQDIQRYGLPLWQDHNLTGSPETFALHFLGVFVYPPMEAFFVLPPAAANTLLHLTIPLFAGLSMYLLLTRLVESRSARLFGSVAWALNGYSVVWLSAFFLPLMVGCIPLLMYLALLYLDERRRWCGVLFAILLGATFYFAYPPASVIVLTLLGVFAFSWWIQGARQRLGGLARLAAMTVLGVGIGMAANLPTTLDLLAVASAVSASGFRGIPTPLPVHFLAGFIFPNMFGSPVAGDWRSAFGNYCEVIAYDGGVTLLLAGVSVLSTAARRRLPRTLVLTGILVLVFSLLMTYAEAGVHVLTRFPPYNSITPPRWQIGTNLGLGMLAAYGLDQLVQARRRGLWKHVAVALAVVLGSALVILFVKRHEVLNVHDFITHDYKVRALLLAAAVPALAWLLISRRKSVPAAAIVALLFVDLFSFGVDYNPATRPQDFYPTPPAISFLQAHANGYRVLAAGSLDTVPSLPPLYSGAFGAYGIDTITGYDHFRDEGFVEQLGTNFSPEERNSWRRDGWLSLGRTLNLDDAVFNLLSVRYAYFPWDQGHDGPAGSAHWRLVYRGPDGTIYENLQVLPKEFVERAGAISPVTRPDLRPDRESIDAGGPGTLVWSRPYDRAWTVTVNGRPVAAKRYAGYYLAVDLGTGDNRVALSYHPTQYYVGAGITGVSLLVAAALLLPYWRRRPGTARP
jgi:hypothetical protein